MSSLITNEWMQGLLRRHFLERRTTLRNDVLHVPWQLRENGHQYGRDFVANLHGSGEQWHGRRILRRGAVGELAIHRREEELSVHRVGERVLGPALRVGVPGAEPEQDGEGVVCGEGRLRGGGPVPGPHHGRRELGDQPRRSGRLQ